MVDWKLTPNKCELYKKKLWGPGQKVLKGTLLIRLQIIIDPLNDVEASYGHFAEVTRYEQAVLSQAC